MQNLVWSVLPLDMYTWQMMYFLFVIVVVLSIQNYLQVVYRGGTLSILDVGYVVMLSAVVL